MIFIQSCEDLQTNLTERSDRASLFVILHNGIKNRTSEPITEV